MISKMAMEDIAALRADGIDVPPREVVRLNVLGLRVERGPESPDVFAAPRVGERIARPRPVAVHARTAAQMEIGREEKQQRERKQKGPSEQNTSPRRLT